MSKIPFFGVDRQYANLREEILEVTDQVYTTGQVLDGVFTKNFEQAIAKMTERRYAIAVNSGTQALIFALRNVDFYSLFKKNKVLIPAQSFVATVNAVIEAGMDPVFCDVDPVTGLIDLNKIDVPPDELAAVMYVNLFGNIIDYDKLQTYKDFWNHYSIPVIEDAAQSFGAYYRGVPSGKLGDISVLSFDPTKNLNNYGSGGMILTDDADFAELCRSYRDNGKFHDHNVAGTNSKMSESDCAQMLVKLKHFPDWQLRRRQIAEYYTEELDGYVELIPVESKVEHAWSKFVVHTEYRRMFQDSMTQQGIETRIHYPVPLHTINVSEAFDPGMLQGAEDFSRTCLSLPIYPELTDSEVEHIVDSIRTYTNIS
jgi:dTDP-4-amino-4,6-dideoxygalactose transaminase